MNQVIAADSKQVAVTGVHHHIQLGIGQLQAGGEGQRTAVGGVKRVEIDVSGDASGAADTGDDRQVLDVDLGVDQSASEGVYAGSDTAAGAPDVGDALGTQERVSDIVVNGKGRHRATSMMAFKMSSGL